MPRNENKKRCKAKNRAGERCKRWAKHGYDVCHNHGAGGGAPKKNSNAKTHGLFAKYLPEETLEIVNNIDDISPLDILWMNIKMQFASIMRAQKIMWVESRDEMIKELKKEKTSLHTDETEYEFQFAWDRQASFLNSQSRAMAELRNMLKQFAEMADYDDMRLLEIEKMKAIIAKNKAETEKIANDDNSKAPPTITIVDEWSDDDE